MTFILINNLICLQNFKCVLENSSAILEQYEMSGNVVDDWLKRNSKLHIKIQNQREIFLD